MIRRCRWWISHLRFAFAHARAVVWMNAWRERQRLLYGSAAANLAVFCTLGAMRQIDREYRKRYEKSWLMGLMINSETISESEQRWKTLLRLREVDAACAKELPAPVEPTPGFTAAEVARGLTYLVNIGYDSRFSIMAPGRPLPVFSTPADPPVEAAELPPERHIYGNPFPGNPALRDTIEL